MRLTIFGQSVTVKSRDVLVIVLLILVFGQGWLLWQTRLNKMDTDHQVIAAEIKQTNEAVYRLADTLNNAAGKVLQHMDKVDTWPTR